MKPAVPAHIRAAWRLTAAMALVFSAFSLLTAVYFFVRIQDERDARVSGQRITNATICRGQARGLVNDIDNAHNHRAGAATDLDNAALQLDILRGAQDPSRPSIREGIRAIKVLRANALEARALAQQVENRALAQLKALGITPGEVRHDNGFSCDLPNASSP